MRTLITAAWDRYDLLGGIANGRVARWRPLGGGPARWIHLGRGQRIATEVADKAITAGLVRLSLVRRRPRLTAAGKGALTAHRPAQAWRGHPGDDGCSCGHVGPWEEHLEAVDAGQVTR